MRITLEAANSSHVHVVQKILEGSPQYFLRTDKSEVKPHFAEREMSDCPPKEKQSATYKKEFCIFYLAQKPIGIVDFHKDHPVVGTTYIGLLLIEEQHQGKGLGRSCYKAAETYARDQLHASKIALGISEANNVEAYWQKMGFTRNGKSYVWTIEGHDNQVFEMEKTISKVD